jgi:hydroxyethylthiazole kinase
MEVRLAEASLMEAWASVKQERPLIFHVTNSVAAALQANACLAIGASPLMSRYPEETEELIAVAQGFLVNLGRPGEAGLKTVKNGLSALKRGKGEGRCFSLLDPVGYGASRFRVDSTDHFLKEHSFSIVKGNAGEISLLAGMGGMTRGVDALSSGDLPKAVFDLARKYRCVVCATGKTDYLSDGNVTIRVRGGSSLLPFLSGSGCVAGTVILSVTAACGDPVAGTLCGLAAMGIASERAEKKCSGSGTFAASLLDGLYALRPEDFRGAGARWEIV